MVHHVFQDVQMENMEILETEDVNNVTHLVLLVPVVLQTNVLHAPDQK